MRLISGSTANECSPPCARAPRERSGDCRLEGAPGRAWGAEGTGPPVPMGEPALPLPPAPRPKTHTHCQPSAPGAGRSPAPEGVSSCRHWSRASVTSLSPRGRAPWALLTAEG